MLTHASTWQQHGTLVTWQTGRKITQMCRLHSAERSAICLHQHNEQTRRAPSTCMMHMSSNPAYIYIYVQALNAILARHPSKTKNFRPGTMPGYPVPNAAWSHGILLLLDTVRPVISGCHDSMPLDISLVPGLHCPPITPQDEHAGSS